MTELPTKLYRAVDKETLNNHLAGTLWFHSHAYFRKLEKGDQLEGVGSYEDAAGNVFEDVSDKHPLQPAYFMSFSETPEGAKTFGREDRLILELWDPGEFRDSIKKVLPDCGFVKVRWLQIEYIKDWVVLDESTDPTGLNRKFRCKPKEFAQEKEWRLQIQFMHSFRIQNDVLKFRWGRKFGHFFADA